MSIKYIGECHTCRYTVDRPASNKRRVIWPARSIRAVREKGKRLQKETIKIKKK
jgi:hypothetical protein